MYSFRDVKKKIIDFIGNIKIYSGGIVFFGDNGLGLKGPDWREILDIIKPGDIVLNAHNHYLSSFFIKGNYGHVGLYVGDNKIIHVIGDGILKQDILTFLRADDVVVVRPENQELVPQAISNAYNQLEKDVQYDYDFNRDDTAQFYCSEFTDFCYGYLLKESVSKDKNFIFPDDYLIDGNGFNVVWKKV